MEKGDVRPYLTAIVKFMKNDKFILKSYSIYFGVIFALSTFILSPCASALDVSAKSAILICADSGSVIWSKNETEPLPMASTTKIMTALLTLEHAAAYGNSEVEITPEMIRVEGTSMGLAAGDIVDLHSLAIGMRLCSGNDSANASAIAVSGETDKFITLMNEKAKSLGMKDTKFSTPSGLDKDNHHSTAHDMAILGSYAMENEEFAKIVSQKSMSVKFLNPSKTVGYRNHNKLLRLYPYCNGIKTGFTKLAGRCLVSSAQKNGVKLVCVTLNAPNDWDDHISLYNYGFENTVLQNFDDKNFTSSIRVDNGVKNEVAVSSVTDFSVSLKKGEENLVSRKVELPESHNAPIEKGQILGKVAYYINDKMIGKNDIIASESVEQNKPSKVGFFSSIKNFFLKLFRINKKEVKLNE